MTTQTIRNRFGFGIGTIGRDACYTLISMYLLFYLSDVLEVSNGVFAAVTIVLVVARLFDAVNDPVMGVIVDNTHGRHGKFKPWILGGAIPAAALTVVLFTPLPLGDAAFVAVFTVVYLAWEISYTANDIGYWSMLPALTEDQKERERIGAVARICASIGVFIVVVGIVPVSNALGDLIGDMRWSYFLVALILAVVLLVFQLTMLVLVREDRTVAVPSQTRFRELVTVIFRNDQLLAATASLLLFMAAFTTTTSFGIYYFRYVYGDEGMYAMFAAVLGVSQLGGLAVYPLLSRRFTRRTLFTSALVVVAAGYVLLFLTPPGGLVPMVVAGVGIFSAQAMIQLQMLMFIADTVEYGEHKLGRRNDSVTLSLQPFIYKLGSAVASGIVGWTVLASGMKEADDASAMTDGGTLLVKIMMIVVPALLIVASYLVYRRFYTLDEAGYARIVEALRLRRAAEHTDDEHTGDDHARP